MKQTRWTQEGDDAAVIAQAILAGNLTDQNQSIKDYFDPDIGPGAEIALKFNFHTAKGKRNLKLNVVKLFRKIQVWKSNKEDPDTGVRKYTMQSLCSF